LVSSYGRRLLPASLVKAVLGLSVGPQDVRDVINAFLETDIFVDIRGIGFADTIGRNTFIGRVAKNSHMLVAKMFGKPVVKYTADLGPFEARWNRFFAKLYLQYAVDVILARSDTTRRGLEELGVTTPTRVCPDTAFLLEPHSTEFAEQLSRQKSDGPVVGFSVSHMAVRQSSNPEGYLDSMARLGDHVVENIGARIVLVPNEFSDDIAYDDGHVAKEVRNRMRRKNQAIIVLGDYTAQQLKGIVGQLDVLVAARYHSIVASLSLGIPVLAVGWHHKYEAVMRLVGQERYLCSVRSLQPDHLREKFDDLWRSKDRIRQEINAALPGIREAILKGGEEVRLLCERKGIELVEAR
jgi:polysaccharide pyruvyl transferase WcaK-like protein